MAKADTSEIDDLAFRLYAERLCKMPAAANGEAISVWAYRKAEEFLATREKVKSGGLQGSIGESKLSEVSAPNLKPTHPHNLVSQRYSSQYPGGEQQVLTIIKEVVQWLEKHPRSDEQPVAFTLQNNSRGIDWDVPTTNLARNILPHYIN